MNKYLQDWMKELDDLDIHLKMDTDEVVEAFEKQKSSFQSFVSESKDKLEAKINELDLGEKGTELKTKLEELQVQLALGKAETRDAFEEQRKNLTSSLHDATKEYDGLKEKAEGQYKELADEFNELTEKFHTKLDVLRVQFALGKADMQDEMKDKKEEIAQKLAEVRKKSEENKEKAEDKWDDFKGEISEAYGHFKSALKGLFD